jgi:hypothetical protein
MGHCACECQVKLLKAEAHATQEDEPSLFLATAVEVKSNGISLPPSVTLSSTLWGGAPQGPAVVEEWNQSVGSVILNPSGATMHLVEEKVHVQFNDAEKMECRRWVLNTAATNHMTRCRIDCSDLDRSIQGTVKLGDGSMVQIEGMGTVLSSCKNGEHRAFISVYYISKLNTNIISVGQLEEIGF